MSGNAHGGNDTLIPGRSLFGNSTLVGDAQTMSDNAQGGDDILGATDSVLSSARGTITLLGDAQTMSNNAHGGDDTLTGLNVATPQPFGIFNSIVVGDAQTMSGNARGGNDILISGTGNDDMWGDAQAMLGNTKGGNDTFKFNFNNGHDKIEDFGQGESNLGTDHINVSVLGIENFSELTISAFDPTTHESTITFSPGNDVVVHSEEALRPQDFIFATHALLLT
jgi:hypothetical protein